jgi:hypothetical protein
MPCSLSLSSFVPAGLAVDRQEFSDGILIVTASARISSAPCVVGVDDWAFRRNHRYGTIVCDLERRQIAKLLPDREIATVVAWLSAHPGIRVVSRDRGGGYGEVRLGPCCIGMNYASAPSERMTTAQLRRPPSARTLARLMTLKRDHLTKAETLTVAAIEKGAPALAEARTLIDRFQ